MKLFQNSTYSERYYSYVKLLQTSRTVKGLIGLLFVILIAFLFPKGLTESYEYPEGSVWNEDDLIAPFAFPIFRNPVDVDKEQVEAVRNTPRSFDRVDNYMPAMRDSLRRFLAYLADICDAELKDLPRKNQREAIETKAEGLSHSPIQKTLPLELSADEWLFLLTVRYKEIQSSAVNERFRNINILGNRIIEEIYKRGYLDREKADFEQDKLALNSGQIENLTPVDDFLDRTEITQFIKDRVSEQFGSDPAKANLVATLVFPLLRPNIVLNNARSQIAVQSSIDKIPRTHGIVKQNERIVSRHERITEEIKAKLDSYQRAKFERTGNVNTLWQFVGKAGHAIAILFFLIIYLFLFRRGIFNNNSRLFLIGLIIFMEALLAFLSFSLPISGPIQFLIFVPAASMLLAIIFDSRVAFYSTVTIAFLVGALRGNDYTIILASLLAGSLALYTVRDIKHRTQIFRSLAFIFIGYAFAIGFDGLQRSMPLSVVTTELAYAFVNALLSPVFTFGLLVFFEKVFRITTDLTLLELSDFNHPLLRELSSRAPGTFHHSIVMGTLAEAAATAIGANPILARVGAYYHDIGKTVEPEYFVENQMGGVNIHDNLSPKESAKKIIGHVERGIELAKEYRLPNRLIEFIPAHHGTTTAAFFLEREKAEHPESFSIEDFQYHGPKPYSKETGIVMLADTIEAAARAIEEPTVAKIEKLIEAIVSKRLNEGELDNCDLTFRELSTVKKSFLNILTGIHHSRIKYPSPEEAEAARKIAERTSKLLNLPTTVDALTKRIKKIDAY